LKREIEALLFATDAPLGIGRLKKLLPNTESADIRTALKDLGESYDQAEHAFMLVEFGGGWQIATRPEYSPIVEKLLKGRRFTRLSKAGLEVLAIIAYRQPLTRLEVDEIRGVNSSGAISTLSERNLITVVGRSQTLGNPLLYGTTREFLNHLGLKGLGQLPDLPELENIIDDREELLAFASQVGRDVSEEELEEYFSEPETLDHDVIEVGDTPEGVTVEEDPADEPVTEEFSEPGEPVEEVEAAGEPDPTSDSDTDSLDPDADQADDTTDEELRRDHGES